MRLVDMLGYEHLIALFVLRWASYESSDFVNAASFSHLQLDNETKIIQ